VTSSHVKARCLSHSRLKYEELIPDTELKAKIDAWLAGADASPADEVMDVDQL
jgi:ubiquitin conjugation factor E4 B